MSYKTSSDALVSFDKCQHTITQRLHKLKSIIFHNKLTNPSQNNLALTNERSRKLQGISNYWYLFDHTGIKKKKKKKAAKFFDKNTW